MMTPGSPPPGTAVAQVVETLDTGGAEHLAIKFANAFYRRGYKSHLYVTSHSGPMAGAVDGGVKVRVFGYRRASIMNPVRFALSIRDGFSTLRSAIVADGIQLIQTHLPSPNFWGLAMQKSHVCQSVATIHNNKEFSYGSQNSLRGKLRNQLYRSIVANCSATIAVSDQVRESFRIEIGIPESRAERLISIANGIDIPALLDAASVARVRARMGVSAEDFVCLGVGRVCEQKNFLALVPVMRALRNTGCPIVMVVAGDGPDLAGLQRSITEAGLGDAIRTLGNITDVCDVMGASDVFVMPSLWEGLPLALLEAMGMGLPVVGYSIKGLNDVVVEGVTGHLVPVDDHEAMARRIEELAGDRARSARMGLRGRELVIERYNLDRVIESLECLYGNILG